jgi:hypothetical protein
MGAQQVVGSQEIIVILAGALAGGLVNGLTGFGTSITALGIWLYALPPTAAASLAVICSIMSQLQTLPMVWRAIRWRRVLPLLVPGVVGVPLGTLLLPHIEPRLFKLGIGCFLVAYPSYALWRRGDIESDWGGKAVDGAVGFGGGVFGGLAGLPGVLPIVWSDIRGGSKEQRRGVLQAFNTAILALALASHALSGLLTRQVAVAAAIAFPATVAAVWSGVFIYRRLGDHGYRRIVMLLLLCAGLVLVWLNR